MLKVWGQDNRLVPGFARELDAQIPGLKRDEDKVEVLARQILASKCVEPVDCIPERAGIAHMLPGQSGQARCGGRGSAEDWHRGADGGKASRTSAAATWQWTMERSRHNGEGAVM